mmetsp:Transcript_20107/g.61004  ORF Transcript_20107/g.61004 Transcript_20107/m.61004 type:complete len:93 (+) Transcript_20107:364-642(+)
MCSATFGDEMWSTRGSGLYSVMNAVKVRQGESVKLILESPNDSKGRNELTKREIEQQRKEKEAEQKKRDALLEELEATDEALRAKKPFFGLF